MCCQCSFILFLLRHRYSKGDGVSCSHIHDDVIIPIPFVVEHQCEVMDLVFAQENIALTKKRKKAHEMNRHFQDTWGVKLPWTKFVLGSNGKVVQVRCKVYSLIDGKHKLLVAKVDSPWKHAGCYKALVAMPRVKVREHYFLKSNAHVVNEKIYFPKGSKTVL